MVSRTERTTFAAWWWTVDKLMLAALATLMLAGIVLSLAASPPVAARLGLDPFYFVNRHVMFLAPAFLVLIATSFLPPRHIRRLALVVFAVSLVLVAACLLALQRKRWLQLLLETADELHLPSDPEFRSALVAYLEWGSRLAVINSALPADTPVQNSPMPAWNWGVPGGPYQPEDSNS